MGLPVTCGLLWWYWPEAHDFVFHPLSVIMMTTIFACDLTYPILLAYVRRTERVLLDGRIVAGDSTAATTTTDTVVVNAGKKTE